MTKSQPNTVAPYLVAQGTQFAAGGMMGVIFPWLIAHELHESQIRVGAAQAIANLPFLFLILVAGALADGRDLRRFLPRIQLAMAIVPILLAITISTNHLTFTTATTLIVVLSVLGSFATPARDALLSHVTPHSLGLARAAALTVAATFGGQVLGTVLAASASTVGAVPLLALQSVLLVTSAIMTSQLRLITPFEVRASAEPALARLWRELADGIVTVWRHERLWTIMFYLSLGTPLFNGMFLVGLPLMVRDVYHGSSGMLSLLFTAFLLGLTASSFGYSRVPAVERPGRLLMLLAPNNILVFAIASTAPSFPYFVALMFWWGLSSGVMMSLTRGMIQVAAPPAYRARVLSILQFANIAGGPLGAVLFGSIAQSTGILTAVAIIPFAVSLQWLGFRFLTRMWHFRREDPPEPPVTSPP